jgi:hypothetical protein
VFCENWSTNCKAEMDTYTENRVISQVYFLSLCKENMLQI